MAINSISFNKAAPSIASSAISPTDTETKNIQNQITSKQQSLNRLSSDSEMSAEEKAKERQEIQTQIAELNRKLRMLRMEKEEEAKKAEKAQEQKAAFSEKQTQESSREDSDKSISAETTKEQQQKINIPPQNIQKILEAGTLLQKERIYQNTSQQKEATENILEAEIKLDELYGTDTSAKKEKLSSIIKQEPFELEIEEKQEHPKFSGKASPVKITFREDKM